MKKRFAALCLTCSALLSLSAPAAAVRAPNDSGQPQSSTGNTSVTIPSDGTLSFDQIGPRVKANNLTLKAAQESLKSAEAMDWDEAIDEMEDAIDAMELQISMLVSSGAGELANAKKNLEHTLKQIAITEGKISNVSDITDGMFDSLSLIALGKYSEMQAGKLESLLGIHGRPVRRSAGPEGGLPKNLGGHRPPNRLCRRPDHCRGGVPHI